jgi:hypothetical protein
MNDALVLKLFLYREQGPGESIWDHEETNRRERSLMLSNFFRVPGPR